ncbi:hypothetical protein [Alkalimonas delamerensis]|uniref:hypothetical protein n=1 Tax=Alkalimonas delamerensis TaxID=265981 RepID=UPI00350EF1C7
MINNSITFIGLDTHKNFFEVAYIEDIREAKPISLGHCCYVLATSLIPQKVSEHVKTYKHDAIKLALLQR